MVIQTFPTIIISVEKFFSCFKLNEQKVQKTVYDSLCKINKKYKEPNKNDKNNLSKRIINLIQAFDHSSAIALGTGLYKHISPVVTLQGNIALHL